MLLKTTQNLYILLKTNVYTRNHPQRFRSYRVDIMYEKNQLTEEEIRLLEMQYKYSFVMYESDILRFKFDVTQFKPNVAYNIQFLDLMPLYNEYYYKYSKEFLNLYKKEFTVIKVLARDSMFLLLLTDNPRAERRMKDLSKMKSFKYKANFTSKERKLLYKLKNGQKNVEHIKGASLYFETLLLDIKQTKEIIEEKEEVYEVYSKAYSSLRKTKNEYLKNQFLKACHLLLEDLQKYEEELRSLEDYKDKLIYSAHEDPTDLDDYYIQDSYF